MKSICIDIYASVGRYGLVSSCSFACHFVAGCLPISNLLGESAYRLPEIMRIEEIGVSHFSL